MENLKIGDTVKIKNRYAPERWVSTMKKYMGKNVIVTGIEGDLFMAGFKYEVSKNGYYYVFNKSDIDCVITKKKDKFFKELPNNYTGTLTLKNGRITASSCILDTSQILDEKEKQYLYNIIRPFKDKVTSITKHASFGGTEYICIKIKNDSNMMFPNFDKNSMYKNMRPEWEYTLGELELE